jgi:hypothetical protein
MMVWRVKCGGGVEKLVGVGVKWVSEAYGGGQ